MNTFLSALDERVLVCDGAMGTMLYTKGVFISRCFDELNISNPQLVREVHLDYVRAGADIIETNTFGGNRTKLMTHGLAEQTRDINIQGARVAREAAGSTLFVAGAIGPLGIRIEPWGKTGIDEARDIFREQAQALLDGGVDVFILETFSDLNEVYAAMQGVREARPQLQRGPADDARQHRTHRRHHIEEAGRPAERGPSEKYRRPEHLPVLPGIHGLICEEVCSVRRPHRRGLLRHDPAAHQSHTRSAGDCRRSL
jgi:hypothetical protein